MQLSFNVAPIQLWLAPTLSSLLAVALFVTYAMRLNVLYSNMNTFRPKNHKIIMLNH